MGNPFSPAATDNASQLELLANSLRLAEGFSLLFAVCNNPLMRAKLITDLRARLPDQPITEVPLTNATPNLYLALQLFGKLPVSLPVRRITCVHGLEVWLPSEPVGDALKFILNQHHA